MTADNELQQSILEELRDEPSVDAAQIGVTAEGGVSKTAQKKKARKEAEAAKKK